MEEPRNDMPVRTVSSKFVSVQYLRALATLTVVAAHATETLFEFGEAAVSLFFVISGFVMMHVSQREVSPLQFLRARFQRVVPLYWLVTVFVATAYGGDSAHLFMSLAFWPHPGPFGQGWPVLGQGWTLVFEVFFYLVFAATLMVSPRARPWVITAVTGSLYLAGLWFKPQDFALATYTSPLLLEFAVGALVYEAWRSDWLPRRLSAASVLVLGVALLILQARYGAPEHRWATWGVTSVVVLAGTLGLERSGWMPRLPFLRLLGDSSYSLYLMQFFVLNPLHKRLGGWPELAAVAVMLAACVVVGLICYVLAERPLSRLSAHTFSLARKRPDAVRARAGLAAPSSAETPG